MTTHPGPVGPSSTHRRTRDLKDKASARAALSLCQSLVIGLVEAKVVSKQDMEGILRDAGRAHENGHSALSREVNSVAARLIHQLEEAVQRASGP